MLSSAGAALIGLIVSILWLVELAGSLHLAFVGPLLAGDLSEVNWGIQAFSYSVLVAGLSLGASVEYWRRSRKGIYLHVAAIFTLLPALSLGFAGVAVLVVSFAILATMAAHISSKPAFIIATAAVSLAFASFFYQQLGPEIGQYGTECVPLENCFRPLLGAGYPLQYMVNVPGITDPTSLGAEDEFRLVPFALDTLFYFTVAYLGYGLIRFYRARRKPPEVEPIAPE
jgi:hypothetical protein